MRNKLCVLLQAYPNALHPLTKKVITTAISLGSEKGYITKGILFTEKLTSSLKEECESSGLCEITVFEGSELHSFIPEAESENFCLETEDEADVVLVPATPEGRTLSSMIAAKLKTGVTADCTELSFNEEGLLVQTRPAFSGNIMASIITKETRPQIASLRFASKAEMPEGKTKITVKRPKSVFVDCETQWLDTAQENKENSDIIIAVGGGLNDKDDLKIFEEISEKLGAELCCSRMLVDRGWLQRKNQIGLSGKSVSPKLLITFGISGSLQFKAGLENIEKLIAINSDENAPILKMADVPIVCDLYEAAEAMLKSIK